MLGEDSWQIVLRDVFHKTFRKRSSCKKYGKPNGIVITQKMRAPHTTRQPASFFLLFFLTIDPAVVVVVG